MSSVVGRVTGQALAAAWRNAGSAFAFSSSAAPTADVAAATMALPLRILRAAGIGTALTAFLLPASAIAALVISGRGEADALEMASSIPRTVRILWWSICAAYSYKMLATSFAAASITEETYREELTELHHRSARRLFRVLHKNGGVYVKAGQLAVSVQSLPPEFREGLVGLEDRVPPRPFADVNAVLQAELGAPASELFKEFAEEATAAASLAQVHRALTHEGDCVAVKVQYAGLESAVAADLATMTALASLAALFFPSSDWRWLFTELRTKLDQELDFRHEANNARRLASCFAGRKDVSVPALYSEYCTRKIITMEWVDGVKVTDKPALRSLGLAPRQVGLVLLDVAAEMMSVHGFVHGDMHPGNLMVRRGSPEGNFFMRLLPWCRGTKPQVVLLDHGLYFEINDEMRLLYNQLWCAFVLSDRATANDVATTLAGPRAGRALPEYLKPRDWSKMSVAERRRLREEVGVGGIRELTTIMNEAPRQLVDCMRALALVRHIAAQLGVTIADRLRVNAVQALRGLRQVEVDGGVAGRRRRQRVEYVGRMRSRTRRWHLWLRIFAMRLGAWWSLALGQVTEPTAPPLAE